MDVCPLSTPHMALDKVYMLHICTFYMTVWRSQNTHTVVWNILYCSTAPGAYDQCTCALH